MKPFLFPVFGSHMVLQRDKLSTFGGWTQPGATVTVSVDGRDTKVTAAADGSWAAKMVPPPVGGPYTIVIDGPSHVELTDVLVGDVWLCGGQSNMEFGVGAETDGGAVLAQANNPGIRLFMDPHQIAPSPRMDIDAVWKVCTPETLGSGGWEGFSAIGYHFGLKVHQELGVPIGLISVNWGGSCAECWISAESLASLGDFTSDFPLLDQMRKKLVPEANNYFDLWIAQHDQGSKAAGPWQTPELDDSQWACADANQGFEALGAPEGVVWFRKTFEVTGATTGVLNLGNIEQIDQVWVNGQSVGGSGWGPWSRTYQVAQGILKEGRNVIVVRVVGRGEKRGFQAQAEEIFLELAGKRLALGKEWKIRIGAVISSQTPAPKSFDQFPNIPTLLFNGMLNPHRVQGIRGAIWYQGESNASRAWQYRTLLPAMIADWRRTFGQGEFPFYMVSLAAFMDRKEVPGDDEWAELREAQALTASTVPHCGLAVAIDVGEANDIHPKNKKPVGERLALVALAKEYGKDVVFSGPVYRQMKVEGQKIRLSFDHTQGGLKVHGEKLGEFSVAGADRRWHWAEATIDGNDILVFSSAVPNPMAVRYAWQSNPLATLYNGAGLPAVPFRTDDWPAITAAGKIRNGATQ